MTRFQLAALLALALPVAAACTATESTPEGADTAQPAPQEETMPAPTPEAISTSAGGETARATPVDSEPERDSCEAGKVRARWMNAMPTAEVKAAIAEVVGKRPIRYYTDGDPITMDYSEDRLNVVLGRDGRIAEFRCG